tara:strand:+ start:8226 stop:9005 length:780 start_codon:yes stop_codon:yes gene_type:complete
MSKLRVLDLFSGIGGFSLGLERTGGFSTVAFCEIEPFPRKVLAKHWPEVPQYEDVKQLTSDILQRDGISVDVITGGFPCQDISVAGNQAGIGSETRSGLWSECKRLVGELRPRYAIFENVTNLLSGPSEQPGGWFSRILSDLAEIGYDAEWENIPAESVGAPHPRNRVWIIAYPERTRREGLITNDLLSGSKREAYPIPCNAGPVKWCELASNSAFIRDGNGLPVKMERDRLKGLGNAVVPQIPQLIGQAILDAEKAAP